MTHDYKEIWDEFVKRNGEQGFFAEAIRHALTIAQEAEQLRKERDDLLAAYKENDDPELLSIINEAKKVRNENGNA